MEPLRLDYFSDVLCVWAYASQVRLDELKRSFGERIKVESRLICLFGDMNHRISAKWADRGGREGFADHLQEVAGRFDHVEIHPDLCRSFVPASSTPAHILLQAVRLAGGPSAFDKAAWRIRLAWFRDNREVHRMPVLLEIAGEAGLPLEEIQERIHSGEAMAAMSRDVEVQHEQGIPGSPTWILNEGRQKLYGNVGYRILEANVQEVLDRPEGGASWC